MALGSANLVAQNDQGVLQANVWFEVKVDIPGEPIAEIFSDRAGTIPLNNPFMSATGKALVFAYGAPYKIRAYKDGFEHIQRYRGIGRGAESDIQFVTPMGEWQDDIGYPLGAYVSFEGTAGKRAFISLVDDNLNHEPDADTPGDNAYWMYSPGVTSEMAEDILNDARDWASKTDGIVDDPGADDYSSKAWAIGGTGVTNTATRGAAKEWAIKAVDTTVDGTGFSALHHATKAADSAGSAATSAGTATTAAGTATAQAGIAVAAKDDAEAAAAAAAVSESNAASSASDADSSKDDAQASALAAGVSEANAGDAAYNAAGSLYQIEETFLGSYSSAPTETPNGNPLADGMSYWNNVTTTWNFYNSTPTPGWYAYSPASGMTALVDDTAPVLGGDLDANSFDITGVDQLDAVAFFTGTINISNSGAIRSGTSAADTFAIQAYDVDGASWVDMFRVTSNNTVAGDLNALVTHGTRPILNGTQEDQGPITGGAGITPKAHGNVSSGTHTPNPGGRALQSYSNNGAHTIGELSAEGFAIYLITNTASAGAVTTSAWDRRDGDAFTTTNGHRFLVLMCRFGTFSYMNVRAMQ